MTVTSTTTKIVAQGDGITTAFSYNFLIPAAGDVEVVYTDTDGNETTLASTVYTITGIANQNGGMVTYPLVGSPIAVGTTLTIARLLPLEQLVSISNQGSFYPEAVEDALDYLMMSIQQVNEIFSRAVVAPISDPDALLYLPTVAQRANQLLGFDSVGNPIAAEPSSALVSSAMQPVVSAATLALARTAFGLGALATEGIGTGLQDDGAGNVRVDFPITSVSTNQAPVAANHLTRYIATGALTFTLPRANTVWSGYQFNVYALTDTITFTPDSHDSIIPLASNTSITVSPGTVVTIITNGASSGSWWLQTVQPAFPQPQGYLSLTSGVVSTPADVAAATTVYYVPDIGNNVPIYSGGSILTYTIGQLSLTLSSSHLANTAYDNYLTLSAGEVIHVTGPAWRNSGQAITGATNASPIVITANAHGLSNGDQVVVDSVGVNTAANGIWTVAGVTTNTFQLSGSTGNGSYTTGTGHFASRGNGTGTAQITRAVGGLNTNAVAMTMRNGATTYSVAANQAVKVGSIFMDGTNGQISCLRSGGQSRRWGVFNDFNRKPVSQVVFDTTAAWTYNTNTLRAADNATANSFIAFVGLPEEAIDIVYDVKVLISNSTSQTATNGIGVNSTSVSSGKKGSVEAGGNTSGGGGTMRASYTIPISMGSQTITALEAGGGSANNVWAGNGNADMELKGTWRA